MGLGNPGAEFAGTRHNVGADAVVELARRHGDGRLALLKRQRALVEEVAIAGHRVALAVPTTYMNDSGSAVALLVRRFGVEDPRSLLVVHDELDLPPGTLQVKEGGGLAGHNGLRSVEAHLHTNAFVRVRVGIGKPRGVGADHVLSKPSRAEGSVLEEATTRAADAVETIVGDGVAAAMNRFNTRAER